MQFGGGRIRVGWPQASGEVPRREKMRFSGTDPESYITEYNSVSEDYKQRNLSASSGQSKDSSVKVQEEGGTPDDPSHQPG